MERFSGVNLPSPAGVYVSVSASVLMVSVLAVVRDFVRKSRHRQTAIEKHKRSVIFEFAVGSPLHANELRREYGEARVVERDDCLGIGDRICDGFVLRALVCGS